MSRNHSSTIVGFLIAVVALLACVVMAAEILGENRNRAKASDFQELVGGLGCGPAVDLSQCEMTFDPRLCQDCSLRHEPVPGAVYFCPQHACSLLFYPHFLDLPRNSHHGMDKTVQQWE